MKVVVLAGGISTERDVSLISGKMIQKFEQEKSNDQFYYFYYWPVFIKPDFPAIDPPLLFSDRVQILIIDVGKILQK